MSEIIGSFVIDETTYNDKIVVKFVILVKA